MGHHQALNKWNIDAAKCMGEISPHTHVVVFITTHSNPVSGDLWLGNDEENKPCAGKVSDVSTGLLYYLTNINYELNSGLNSFWVHLKPYLMALCFS